MNSTDPPVSTPDPNEFDGQSIIPVVTVTIALSTIFVGLRFWSRAVILRIVGVEDWFILAALVFAVGTSVAMAVQLHYGLGRHFLTLSPDTVVGYFKASLFTIIVYALGLTFAKISILCLYIRVLTYEYVRLAAKVLLGIVVVSHMWILLTLLTLCVPMDAFWDFSKRQSAHCHPLSVYWSHAGLNIATDFLIFMLPLTVLHKLRIPRSQKVALYLVFLLAFGVCVVSILRSVQLAQSAVGPTWDLTWDAVSTANWTMIEVNSGVVCACLTTIKPIVVRLLPRLLSSRSTGEGHGNDTIGHARQIRRSHLESEAVTSTSKSTDGSSTVTESVRMTDLEMQKDHGSSASALQTMPAAEKLVPPARLHVRPEQSYDSLGRPEVSSHSVL